MVRSIAAILVAGSLIAIGCEEKPGDTSAAQKAADAAKNAAGTAVDKTKEAASHAAETVKTAAADLTKAASDWGTKIDGYVKQVTDSKAPAGAAPATQSMFDSAKAAVLKAADEVKAEVAKLKDAKPESASGLLDSIKTKFSNFEQTAKEFLAKKWDAATAPASGGK